MKTVISEPYRDLKWTRRSTLEVNLVTMETSVEGIFAAGDAVSGSGNGNRSHRRREREPPVRLTGILQEFLSRKCLLCRCEEEGKLIELPSATRMILKRPVMPLLNLDRRRTTFQQVELGYPENAVREEARRCLRCDICLRCGKCVEICRDKMKINALKFGYLDFDHPVNRFQAD